MVTAICSIWAMGMGTFNFNLGTYCIENIYKKVEFKTDNFQCSAGERTQSVQLSDGKGERQFTDSRNFKFAFLFSINVLFSELIPRQKFFLFSLRVKLSNLLALMNHDTKVKSSNPM